MSDVASHRLVRQTSTKRWAQCRDEVDGCNTLLATPKLGKSDGAEESVLLEFYMHICSPEIGRQSERKKMKTLQILKRHPLLESTNPFGILQMELVSICIGTFRISIRIASFYRGRCKLIRLSMGQRQSSTKNDVQFRPPSLLKSI